MTGPSGRPAPTPGQLLVAAGALAALVAAGGAPSLAGPPTRLTPSDQRPTVTEPIARPDDQDPGRAGAVPTYEDRYLEPRPAAPAAGPAAPGEDPGFGERAGRAIDGAARDTGDFFSGMADAAGETFGRIGDAAGNAFDWIMRETGDLMERGGRSVKSLGE